MKALVSLVLFISLPAAFAQTGALENWLKNEVPLSQTKIFESMSFPDLAPGAIVASPSRSNPDYYYHWVRDAGFVMDVVVDLYARSTDADQKKALAKKIKNYISFSIKNQTAQTLTDLGEPKFYVNGSPYNLPWGRPQNDGPALRALALIKWAQIRIAEGHGDEVTAELYDNHLPASSIIKRDLEYVAAHWNDASFDLWEEVLGDHFFTRFVQRSALLKGAQLAQTLGDMGASDWYLKQAFQIEGSLKIFASSSYNYIPATLNTRGDRKNKDSNLDSAIILALLRAPNADQFLPWTNVKVVQTLETLIQEFAKLYSINKGSLPGVALGRYTEDVYSGGLSNQGNAWVLTTLAAAESYYEMAQVQTDASQIPVLIEKGDQFFLRVKYHANGDGSLSEQIQRENGEMVSANNLTWNYAAVITANWARERALSQRLSIK